MLDQQYSVPTGHAGALPTPEVPRGAAALSMNGQLEWGTGYKLPLTLKVFKCGTYLHDHPSPPTLALQSAMYVTAMHTICSNSQPRSSPRCVELQGSLPCSQQPATSGVARFVDARGEQ
jgi:hypothetical protein